MVCYSIRFYLGALTNGVHTDEFRRVLLRVAAVCVAEANVGLDDSTTVGASERASPCLFPSHDFLLPYSILSCAVFGNLKKQVNRTRSKKISRVNTRPKNLQKISPTVFRVSRFGASAAPIKSADGRLTRRRAEKEYAGRSERLQPVA